MKALLSMSTLPAPQQESNRYQWPCRFTAFHIWLDLVFWNVWPCRNPIPLPWPDTSSHFIPTTLYSQRRGENRVINVQWDKHRFKNCTDDTGESVQSPYMHHTVQHLKIQNASQQEDVSTDKPNEGRVN